MTMRVNLNIQCWLYSH